MTRSTLFRSSGCALFRRSRWLQLVITGLLAPGLMTSLSPVRANPYGGVVVHGDVSIGAGTGGNLQIHQSSNHAIIDWESFSIDAGELTRFLQPGSSSAVLNRVTGADPTAIHGALQGNGNVFVINPNGILVGAGGTIDVHGLVLSTLDVSNGEFLAGGDQVFKGASDKGVTNLGRINAIGGDVFLIGRTVENSGSISASSGRVGLAAGEEVLLTAAENASGERMFVRASGSGVSGTGIYNDGSIEGAAVEMKAHGNIYALAINNKGTVRATGASNAGGRVYLRGAGGVVSNSGSIRATSSGSGKAGRVLIEAAYAKVDGMIRAEGGSVKIAATEKAEVGGNVDVSSTSGRGGEVLVEGPEIKVGGGAVVNASGTEGGSVRIGGGFQGRDADIANAETLVVESGSRIEANGGGGDAGSVILWSDGDTRFEGSISAQALGSTGNGGFVEVSGKETLSYRGVVSTLSASGQNGTLLLDPTDFEVIVGGVGAGGVNQISNTDLIGQLALGNVVIATDSAGTEDGTITVETGADVLWSGDNSLALLAHGDIQFNASVQASGLGNITAVAGWDGTTGFGGVVGVPQPGAVDFADFVADVTSYGNTSGAATGTIYVGDGNQTAGIAVGSWGGSSNFGAHGIEITSGNSNGAFSQVGFRPVATATGATGSIALHVKEGGLNLTAGIGVDDSFAQVGHGGTGATNSAVSGNIFITFAAPGDVALRAGGSAIGRGNYAQIGHGGNNWDAAKSGSITIDGANNVSVLGGRQDGYAQIGHGGSKDAGGSYGSGVATGNVSVLNTAGKVTVLAGSGGENGYAQIGHGGIVMAGNVSGEIEVHSGTGGILVQGGGGTRSSALIGNGGYNSDYSISGNVTVLAKGAEAGDGIVMKGGTGTSTASMIGGGQYLVNNTTITGDTIVEVLNGGLSMTGGSGGFAFVTIGHGNRGDSGNSGSSDMSGTVEVTVSGGDLTLKGGSGNMTSVQIGHGGNSIGGTRDGAITVEAAGGISVSSGPGSSAYAHIGHGGYNSAGGRSGAVSVTALTGAVQVDASGGRADGYAQIGHGGIEVNGMQQGAITVSAANGIGLQGGNGQGERSFAQIGHGGVDSDGNKSGAIQIDADSDANGSGDLVIVGGSADRAYALIGHGGIGSDGFLNGRIEANVGGDLTMQGGSGAASGLEGNFNFAQIGHSLAGAAGGFNDNVTGFLERDGMIVGEAEFYHANSNWVVRPEGFYPTNPKETPVYPEVTFSGSRGGWFLELPDGQPAGSAASNSGSYATYTFTTGNDGGTYRLYPSAAGFSGGSDSLYMDIVEIKDGVGAPGVAADWYLFAAGNTGVFSWKTGSAGHEQTATTTGSNPTWDLAPNSTYTLRVNPREDGVAFDSWMLVNTSEGASFNANAGVTFTHASGVSETSDIVVTAGGNIALTGGANSDSYATIGHGGSSFLGVNSNLQYGSSSDGADISVISAGGNILLDGNAAAPQLAGSAGRYAVIGHHGVDAGFDAYGTVAVRADAGSVTLRGGNAADSFAAIGHSGGGDFLDAGSTRQGDITVVGTDGIDLGMSGTGEGSYAQIGHGGSGVAGDLGGDIVAVADAGAVSVAGGSGAGQFAQIGHGGSDADGALSGEIHVVAGGGDLALAGGSDTNAYAMVGHGDGAGTSDGTRQGGIHLFSSGQISATNGGSEAHLFHQSDGDLAAGDYLGGGGLQVVGNGGLAVSDAALRGVNTMIAGNWNQGPISLAFSNDIDLLIRGINHAVTTSDEFYLMTGGSIVMEAGYQNAGDGGVFLVAGWNGLGATFDGSVSYAGGDFSAPDIAVGDATFAFSTPANFGHNSGAVTIGSAAQSTGVAVGSRAGLNGVAAHGLTLHASDTTVDSFTQFGFRNNGSGQVVGAIEARLGQGGLSLFAGDAGDGTTTGGSYAQIGHGGTGTSADGSNAALTISFQDAGAVVLDGGGGYHAYAQIGHGGNLLKQNNAGDITISNALQVDVHAGGGHRSDARIGHGGHDADGSHNGDIEIRAANAISVAGGLGQQSVGQIGHGGYEVSGARSGHIVLSTTDAGAGNGIFVQAGTSTVGIHTYSYGQIGHGGFSSGGNISGDITLESAGNIAVLGGIRDGNYALLGHGGRSSSSIAYGAVNLTATGDIDAIGGTNDYAFAQIGHGGASSSSYRNAASVGGDVPDGINVTSGGMIRVHGGDQGGRGSDGPYAYAQIGMGGTLTGGPFDGGINVSAQTGVEISGGGRDHNYARIGHGGNRTASNGTSTRIGDISVSTATGDIVLAGGLRKEFTSASIGHGGYNLGGTSTGDIRVSAEAGKVILIAGGGDDAVQAITTTGDHSYSSAQIGHGVANVVSGELTGDICVVGFAGVEMTARSTTAGEGERAQTQIGHGGYNARGDFSGSISVVAPDGSVTLAGGQNGSEGQYSQIGHGGLLADGLLSGDITVVAGNGDTELTGGDGADNYAMIGHGDGAKTSSGQRQGGVHLFSTGQLIGSNGSGTGSDVWIFHQNENGLLPGDYLGGNGYRKIAEGGMAMAASALVHESTMINGNIGVGLVQIVDNTDQDYVIDTSDLEINTSADFYIVTGGNITMLSSYQNAGTGDVILVAGWDKTSGTVGSPTLDYGDPVSFCHPVISSGNFDMDFNNCDAFGNNGKTLTLGSSSQTSSVVIGSRRGSNILAAYGIVLAAGDSDDAFTQLGFRPTATSSGATGDILLRVKEGGLLMTGGAGVTGSFVQIGHGGTGAANAPLGGDISIDFCAPGDVVLAGGSGGSGSYAQIGHGGSGLSGDISGAVTISGADALSLTGGGTLAYARIGHGGANGSHDISAAPITVEATSVDLRGGSSQAHAQIGHGGYNVNGSSGSGSAADSAISVTTVGTSATDGIRLRGGTGADSHAMIGSGGRSGSFDALGDVTVTSAGGGISLEGTTSYAFALIGNGGHAVAGDFGGTTTVTSNGGGSTDGILLKGGTGSYSFANIGHATNNVTASMLNSDTIVNILGGGLTLEAGSGTLAVAAIGLQGRDFKGDRSGLVDVTVTSGDVTMTAGTGTASFAQLGHGGWGLTASAGDMGGNVTLTVENGTLTMNGGAASGTNYGKFAMIGHGGGGAYAGAMGGSVIVDVEGAIAMNGGTGIDGFTQIGHGGRGRSGTFGAAGDVVEVTSRTADLLMAGGEGSRAFSMIGFGGGDASGATSGSVFVDVQGTIAMAAGDGSDSFTLIGHGGRSLSGTFGSADDVVEVTSHTAGLSMLNGNGSQAFSMIGMGGSSSSGSKTGDITVSTVSGVLMDGTVGDGAQAFVHIGHGGYSAAGSGNVLSGNVSVTGSAANSAVTLLGGDESESYQYALIGHGGRASAASGGKSGDITVAAGSGGVTLKGGGTSTVAATKPDSFAQIGHGGSTSSGVASGEIRVTTTNGGDIILHGGGRQYTHAQIGHGGRASVSSSQSGSITVISGGKVEVKGSVYSDTGAPSANSSETFAQIGHGGMFAGATFGGAITVEAQTGVLLESGASTYARAQVGHGGYQAGTSAGAAVEMVNAAITVTTVDGGVILDASKAGGYSLAQIGHGGTGVNGTVLSGAFRGDITVDGGTGNIELHSGVRGASGAMIGNGGANLSGNHSGKINVSANGDLVMDLAASTSNNTFSRIGHGGIGSNNSGGTNYSVSGDLSGDIHVEVGGKALLDASGGRNTDNYVQVGHGGSRVTGNLSGNVTLLTGGGDGIALTGGNGTGAYAQIGHGGVDSVGNKSGAISVDSGPGGLTLTGGFADSAYALVGHGGVGTDGYVDGLIDVKVGGDLAIEGGGGAFSFAQIGHSLTGARGGWGGLVEVGGLIVGEAEWYDGVSNWVVRPEGFYPTNPGGEVSTTLIANGGFTGSRNGWFLEVPDGQTVGAPGSSEGTYALYTFTTGNEGGTYRLYSHATGFNGNSDSLYMDIVEIKDGVAAGSEADWYFMGTGGTGVFSWNTGNGGFEHTSGTTGPPVWDLDPNATYTLRIKPREDGVSIDSWMLANISEGASFDADAAVTFAEANGVGVGSDVNVSVGGNITLIGGAGGESHAVIGHRGDGLDYDLSGNVHVEGQNIALTGGLGSGSSAQIGHGGLANANVGGILDGAVHVRSRGDLSLQGGGSADRTNAIIGHGDVGMSGIHSGEVLIRAAGATVLADGSGSGAVLGHAGIDDTTGDTRFALITETLDNSTATLHGLGDTIARMLPNGSIDIGVQQGDLRVGGTGDFSDSSGHVHLFAGGNVFVDSLVQNSGTGSVGLVAGWDSTTGLIESYPAPGGVPVIFSLELDIAPIIGDDTTWGNNGGAAHIGDGNQTTAAAFGSGGGSTTLFGHAVTVTGSDLSPNAYAQIGTLAPPGTSPTGSIQVATKEGGVRLTGGNQLGTHAQIGHRSFGSGSPALSGDILIASLGGLDLTGGGELLASAQIGHGGVSSTIGSIDGDILLFVMEGIHIVGGSGSGTYAQVGHGGLFTHGDFSGDVAVVAGGDIAVRSSGTGAAAYAKTGHGDDLRGPLAGQSGTGTRTGDIAVSAGADLELENALVGHVYDLSRATAGTGETWIGVARTDPTDPAAGNLVADVGSEFSGAEGVRFYLPRRANNQIAAGAMINGEVFDGGALYEPWPVQRPDEFTNFLTDANGVTSQPGEHDNSLGSGPAPVVPGNYAMYFHQIVLGGSFPPPPVDPDAPGGADDGGIPGGDGPGFVYDPWAYGYASAFPDDRSFDDWLRDQEEKVSGWGHFLILYEGFEHYGFYGESIFRHEP